MSTYTAYQKASVFMPTQKTVLFYENRNSTSMEQIACVPADVSYFLCCTRKSKAAFILGARTRCPSTVLAGY